MGRGNHSPAHVQKLKPAVERICRNLGLQYATEENAGRIYIDLTGGPAHMPVHPPQQHHGQYHAGQHGGGYPGQQHTYAAGGHAPGQGQNDQNAEIEAAVKKLLPRVLKKIEGCCIVM